MIRALILCPLAALALAGCSGKAQTPDADPAATTAPGKPNPWSSDGAMPAAADPKAPAAPAPAPPAADAPGSKPAAPGNPWNKDGAPGPAPAASAAPASDAK